VNQSQARAFVGWAVSTNHREPVGPIQPTGLKSGSQVRVLGQETKLKSRLEFGLFDRTPAVNLPVNLPVNLSVNEPVNPAPEVKHGGLGPRVTGLESP
jgi:hypothetical protein